MPKYTFEHQGRTYQSLREFEREQGWPVGTLSDRLRSGRDLAQALAMPYQPVRNRARRMIKWCGRTQSAAAWSREKGVPLKTILSRLNRGWPPGHAITTPVGE